MLERVLGKLVIGGAVVLCLAPNVRAEDKTTLQWEGNAVSNSDFAIPVPVSTATNSGPTKVEAQRPMLVPVVSGQMPEQYRSLVESISHRNGVDPNLVDAMIRTESNYNPWAVSPKGAMGLMQLMPETGRRFGVSNFFDPQQNIEGGVRFMKYLLNMFDGNVDLSLAAYNAGENLVSRIQKIPPYPETRNYVGKIRAAYSKAKPSKLNIASSLTNPVSLPIPAASSKAAAATPGVSPEKASEKVEAAPVAPIEKWMDERGVRHFSNIEPK